MARLARSSGLLGAALLFGCLPVDTRPPPGAVHVSVHGNTALADGIPLTSDGWNVRYDRFLVTIGHSWLAGDECDVYSDAAYDRIVDATRSTTQKLALLFGEGRCGLAFAVTGPNENSLIGEGVTEDDKSFLLESAGTNDRISIRAEGTATAGERIKRFSWYYRRYSGYLCGLEGDSDLRFVLNGNEAVSATVALRGEALFELERELAPGVLRFEPFAEADDLFGDGNGEITTDELERTPSPDLEAFATLQGQLDSSLFPAVPELEQRPCRTIPLNERLPNDD